MNIPREFDLYHRISCAINAGITLPTVLESVTQGLSKMAAASEYRGTFVNADSEEAPCEAASDNFQKIYKNFSSKDVQQIDENQFQSSNLCFFPDRPVELKFKINGEHILSIILFFNTPHQMSETETRFIRCLSEQGCIALKRALDRDRERLQMFRATIENLVHILALKDSCTYNHCLNVANFSKRIAIELRLSPTEVLDVYHGGLLHDIGKIGMEDAIIGNLGRLSCDQFQKFKQHPVIAAKILKQCGLLEKLVPLAENHHERFNGSGYPSGKKGENIPLGARIIAVGDVFDAMISQRPNTTPISMVEAVIQIKSGSGTLFDPAVVDAFIRAKDRTPSGFKPFNIPL